MAPKNQSFEWAVEQAKAGELVRRSSWPFFAYLRWSEGAEVLTWTCGSAGLWLPTSFDLEYDGKPSCGSVMVGATVGWISTPEWEAAEDWEICDPTWGEIVLGSDFDPEDSFVVDCIAAAPPEPSYVHLTGSPPSDAVRPLTPGEGNYGRWAAHGLRAYALA